VGYRFWRITIFARTAKISRNRRKADMAGAAAVLTGVANYPPRTSAKAANKSIVKRSPSKASRERMGFAPVRSGVHP
jgi:hypothetical protein